MALPPSIRVRLAGPRDCEALCKLLDRPEHAEEQVMTWLQTPGTTLLVAQSEFGILAVAVLLTRIIPRPDAGMHKVVEVDNLVVRADQRGRRIGRRLLAAVVEWSRQRIWICPCGGSAGAGGMNRALSFRVRPASMGDYEALCLLFDELDEFHRLARPEMFQPFGPPALARQCGAIHVEVTVHDFNHDAERFYRAFGFARSMNRLMLAA